MPETIPGDPSVPVATIRLNRSPSGYAYFRVTWHEAVDDETKAAVQALADAWRILRLKEAPDAD